MRSRQGLNSKKLSDTIQRLIDAEQLEVCEVKKKVGIAFKANKGYRRPVRSEDFWVPTSHVPDVPDVPDASLIREASARSGARSKRMGQAGSSKKRKKNTAADSPPAEPRRPTGLEHPAAFPSSPPASDRPGNYSGR